MRNSEKINVPYQFGYVFVTHLGAVGIAMLLQLAAFWPFIGRNVLKEIMGVVFTAIYAGMIYHSVRKLSLSDHKSYTPLKPSVFKGVMFGAAISAVTILIYILWKYAWVNFTDETGLTGVGIVINLLFTFWTFPYFGLMGASHGMITTLSKILLIAVPIAASLLGYLAGKHKIDLLDIFERFSYEADNETEEE